jgi:hypothetical protein
VLAHLRARELDGARPDRRRGAASERGETLPEMLVTVILMGVGFTAVLSAIFTSVNIARVNADRTSANLDLQSWAERVQQPSTVNSSGIASTTYRACGVPAYDLPAPSEKQIAPGFVAEIVSVEALTGFSGGQPVFGPGGSGCVDKGLQRLTLRISAPTRKGLTVRETVTVIKRSQVCPPQFNNADLGPC